MTTSMPATQQMQQNAKPRFVISGNSIEEVSLHFAELVAKTQAVALVNAKRGGSKYGIWELADGEGLTLDNKQLALEAGIPLYLGISVVYRKLSDPAQYEAARREAASKKAATITRLKEQLARLGGQPEGE